MLQIWSMLDKTVYKRFKVYFFQHQFYSKMLKKGNLSFFTDSLKLEPPSWMAGMEAYFMYSHKILAAHQYSTGFDACL